MDCHHYITELPERKRGQHLQREERGAIQALKQQGLSNRAIARELGCSPNTIRIWITVCTKYLTQSWFSTAIACGKTTSMVR